MGSQIDSAIANGDSRLSALLRGRSACSLLFGPAEPPAPVELGGLALRLQATDTRGNSQVSPGFKPGIYKRVSKPLNEHEEIEPNHVHAEDRLLRDRIRVMTS